MNFLVKIYIWDVTKVFSRKSSLHHLEHHVRNFPSITKSLSKIINPFEEGGCGSFVYGDCDELFSKEIVEKFCLGKSNCTVNATYNVCILTENESETF